MKLLIATRNRHKLQEIKAILGAPNLQLMDLHSLPQAPVVEEDGETFEDNAIRKARELATATGFWTLADDSGLVVEALNGEPGVRSARYAGEPSSDSANNRKLLAKMAGMNNRRAKFVCAIALSDPRGRTWTVSGECRGRLIGEERGNLGFGYDPLFMPDGYGQTFGELQADTKNKISHRAAALRQAKAAWASILASGNS